MFSKIRHLSSSLRRILFLFGAVVAALFVTSILLPPSVTPYQFKESGFALDCQNAQVACSHVNPESRNVNCEEWYDYQTLDELVCEETTVGTENLQILADPANAVTGRITDQSYRVETLVMNLFGRYKFSEKMNAGSPVDWLGKNKLWDLEFLPDGSFMITQKEGKVWHFTSGRVEKILEIEVLDENLLGLMGLAIDPDFSYNGHVYLHYATGYDQQRGKRSTYNRVSRFTYRDGALSDELILLDDIPASLYHGGGRVSVGPDGKLYVSTGDAERARNAMDPQSLEGKILRMNRDGSVPDDNPFPGSYIYSSGHRNVQGLAWQPLTDELYASEHGNWRYDELNHIMPGANYGWGAMACDEKNPVEDITPSEHNEHPIACFKEWTLAPSGMVFVDDPDHPWFGDLFVAGLRGKHLHRFILEETVVGEDEIFYITTSGQLGVGMDRRLRDVEFHKGSLYVLGDWSGLIRITPLENIN